MSKEIYILHKSGANSHYSGLKFLLESHNGKLHYREFSIISKLLKSVIKLKPKLFYKQLINILFLIKLLFTKNKKIVIGIAPFDLKLTRLLPLLKRHQIYYHTSWANWDGSFVPKSKNTSTDLKNKWSFFLKEQVKHIFAVTNTSKQELITHYKIDFSKISVVNHSFNPKELIYDQSNTSDTLSFLYVGRLLQEKGVAEMLEYFSKHPDKILTLVGKGKLEDLVTSYAKQYTNIIYKGYIHDKKELSKIGNRHHFILNNSKRTKKWEELFGMALIEGMALGLIPIGVNHPGPNEIISNEVGYLFQEGELEEKLNSIEKVDFDKKQKSHLRSKQYTIEAISEKWVEILESF